MRPLEDLRARLPRHLHLFATPTLWVFFCDHCGYLGAWHPGAETAAHILTKATSHRCGPAAGP